MPPSIVNKVAKTIGKEEAERRWQKAKRLATKQYPDIRPKTENWYKIVMGIFKQMTGYKKAETFYSFVRSVHEEYGFLDYLK